MSKIFLIIQREFMSRVKKKSFLLTTILVPLIFPAIMGTIVYFITQEEKNAANLEILVLDESGEFESSNNEHFKFSPLDTSLEQAKIIFKESGAYALLYIPDFDIENPNGFALYGNSSASLSTISEINDKLDETVRKAKLDAYHVDQSLLDKLKTDVNVLQYNISEGAEKESNVNVAFWIGYVTGFLIYIFMFAYGAQVMQGVQEEKSSKIVEVIISTVKPFQLMLGKILGIASVGLVQVLIWIVLMTVVYTGVMAIFGVDLSQSNPAAQNIDHAKMAEAVALFDGLPIGLIIFCFIFYFLGGYLLYGSLFAAAGSAVDSPSEAQQFMLPIMIPLIAGIIGMTSVVNNPDGPVSFWLSIIPLTSPITMMGRIGYGVPAWQLILSMALLILGFLGTVWLAGRVYRIGILMHGTKVNYKILARWITMK